MILLIVAIIPFLLFFAVIVRFLIRALLSIFRLNVRGIDILPIGFQTIISLFEKNSKKLFENLLNDFTKDTINKGIYGFNH